MYEYEEGPFSAVFWDAQIVSIEQAIARQKKEVETARRAYDAFTEPDVLWERLHTEFLVASRALDMSLAELGLAQARQRRDVAELTLREYLVHGKKK